GAKILAKELNYIYSDTGAMYRAVTYLAITNNVTFSDEEGLVSLIKKYPISFSQQEDGQHVIIATKDVTLEIRHPDVTKAV
ncbi:(d)CMP kinase, partial [Enterococcus faecium]|uniref:(d)CMP kinase n=1 Tax=Enterococcus faecium TaxID=1352 RepID=UPI003CC54BF6